MTPFVGPSYNLALRKADIQRSVNMYLVGLESAGKAPFVLQSVPGYALFAEGPAAVRGMLKTNDRCFIVMGDGLYEQTFEGNLTNRGTLSSNSGTVEMAYGVTQLVIVDGASGYVLTLADNTFAEITELAFYGSDTVTFFDNYFVFVRPDTGQHYISGINDALTFDALDFATAESKPDNLVATIAVQRRLLMMGTDNIEIWSDSGGSDYPFEREGTTIEVGCIAPHSVKGVDNTAFWVGGDEHGSGIVYRLQGYQAQRISTQGIEQALQASTDLTQAVAYCYQENGLTFYALNAPGLTSTWVYEVSTGAWHERCDLDSMGQLKADRGTHHVFAFGHHLIGGNDGNIYRLDASVHTKAGAPLVRERVSPHSSVPGLKRQFFDAFHLDCTTGAAPQGTSPEVSLSWSGDSGASWSNAKTRSTGRVGERINRVSWFANVLGGGKAKDRDRIWKLRFTHNAAFDIVNVQIESHQGNA